MARRAAASLAGGGRDRFARRSPLTGEVVPQRVFRQHQAEVKLAKLAAAGVEIPVGKSPRAALETLRQRGVEIPSAREPRAKLPVGRRRNVWNPLGSQGNRVLTTASEKRVESALRGVARRGNRVAVTVKGRVAKRYRDREQRARTEATLYDIDPRELLDNIRSEGSVTAGLLFSFEATNSYDEVTAINDIIIKELT